MSFELIFGVELSDWSSMTITLELWLLEYCCRLPKTSWSINNKCFTRCMNIYHSLTSLNLLHYFQEMFLGWFWGNYVIFSKKLAWFVNECAILFETTMWEFISDYKVYNWSLLIAMLKHHQILNHWGLEDRSSWPYIFFIHEELLVIWNLWQVRLLW